MNVDSILNYGNRLFRTDVRYLIKGGFWLTLAKVLSMIATFATSVAFANLLPEETYGMFRYILSVSTLLAIPTLQGIETAITRSVAQGNEPDYQNMLKTRIKWGLLGGLASLSLAGYYFINDNYTLTLSFLIVAIFIPFMDSLHTYSGILQGKKKFNILARDEVVTRAMASALIVVLLFYTQNILLILLAYFASTTVFRMLFLWLCIVKETGNKENDSEVVSYGKHLTAMRILPLISMQLDSILLFQIFGSAPLATYYVAQAPQKHLSKFMGSLTTLALPKFATNTPEVLVKTLPSKVLRLYLIITPIVITYILVAPYLFHLLFPKYPDSVLVTQIMILQLMFFPLSLMSSTLTAHSKQRDLHTISISFSVARVVLALTLIPTFGIIGGAIALLLNGALTAGLGVYFFFKLKSD